MLLDMHTHIGNHGRSAENVLAHIDAYGGGRSVVLPIASGDCTAMGAGNDSMRTELALEAHDQYGERVIPFCHVNPMAPDALDQMRAYYDTGEVHGVGEHKVKLPCDHPFSIRMYRLCGELGWPVLIHFDYSDYHNYNFGVFESVIQACPDTVFIGHAMAWWANLSADVIDDPSDPEFRDYPSGPVVSGGLTDRWLSEYPNLYADLSARSGYFGLSRDPEFGKDFAKRHRDKLVWGTDCPCVDGKGNMSDGGYRDCLAGLMLPVLKEYCESDEHYEDITHRNAERLLGLEVS